MVFELDEEEREKALIAAILGAPFDGEVVDDGGGRGGNVEGAIFGSASGRGARRGVCMYMEEESWVLVCGLGRCGLMRLKLVAEDVAQVDSEPHVAGSQLSTEDQVMALLYLQ